MGGYKILNFLNQNFAESGSSITVPGLFEALESNLNKPCMICAFSIASVDHKAEYVSVAVSGSDFVLTAGTGETYTVTDEDEVTYTV